MKIVTFNVRCSWDGDGINSILHRAGGIVEKIRKEKPHVICFQECTDKIFNWLNGALWEYHLVFNQRNADRKGEGLATALRKDSAQLLGLDAFWLSPTPELPGSRYEEQSNCPRICQCVTVRCENRIFRVYNVHLDHQGELARKLGMDAVLQRIAKDQAIQAFPLFLLGDFNATPEEAPLRSCASFGLVELTAPIDYTFHFYGKQPAPYKIDYIYTDASTAEKEYSVAPWDDVADGIWLSDHFPLAVEISL